MTTSTINQKLFPAILAKLIAGNQNVNQEYVNIIGTLPNDVQDYITRSICKYDPNIDLNSLVCNNGHKTLEELLGKNFVSVPKLPESVQFDPDIGGKTGQFIDMYTEHASKVSPMTPILFHESAALFIVSAIIARRLMVRMPFANIYPNLYIIWIAETTRFRKSTGLDIASHFLQKHFPYFLGPQETTPEAILSDLAGKKPANYENMQDSEKQEWKDSRHFAAQRSFIMDEFSGTLAGMGRDYNRGLLEAYLRFYDCVNFKRSTKGDGHITVRNTYVSILSASTPAAMSTHLNEERLWSNGFWPRFTILVPEEGRAQWIDATPSTLDARFLKKIGDLHKKLPKTVWPNPPKPLEVTMAEGVNNIWNNYNKAVSFDLGTDDLDYKLKGTYGRLPVQTLKVAIILACLDWDTGTAPVIEPCHLNRAISITENWRASVHRTLHMALSTNFDQMRIKVFQILNEKYPNALTNRDFYRAIPGTDPDEMEKILNQMYKIGDLDKNDQPSGPKGGRKTTIYSLPN